MNEKSNILIALGLILTLVGVIMFMNSGDGLRVDWDISTGESNYIDDPEEQALRSFGVILTLIGIGVGTTGVLIRKPGNEQALKSQENEESMFESKIKQLDTLFEYKNINQSEYVEKKKALIEDYINLESINIDSYNLEKVLIKLQNLKKNNYLNENDYNHLRRIVLDKLKW